MSDANAYESITREILVKRREQSIFDYNVTSVKLDDEAAGCFIKISQETDDDTVKSVGIDTREWPLIRSAIDELVLIAEEQNGREEDTYD